ncbi:MAG: helix-turn-helix domain-containing protein [Candidatus Omnitrophota bacterium]|jgi:excisionase family DNA binding protein
MPEKLLTAEEAAGLLGISEEEIKKMVKKGELPAYQIGGRFLRFRREQIEAIKNGITAQLPEGTPAQPSVDKFLDFLYFNDFYIISAIIAFLILLVIIKT